MLLYRSRANLRCHVALVVLYSTLLLRLFYRRCIFPYIYCILYISREMFRFSYCVVSSTTLCPPIVFSHHESSDTKSLRTPCVVSRALAKGRGHFFFLSFFFTRNPVQWTTILVEDDDVRHTRTAVDFSLSLATRVKAKAKRKE